MVHIPKWKFWDVTLFLYIILIVPSSTYTHRRRWQQVFFGRHQAPSRRRPTALTTWVGHPKGANSDTGFRGMTRSGSPSLHAILEESPN
jgi:hypothetical protein